MEAALELERRDPSRPPPQEVFAHIELGRMLYSFMFAVLKETSDDAARWQLLIGLEFLFNVRLRLAHLVLTPACNENPDYGPLLVACGTLHETVSTRPDSALIVGSSNAGALVDRQVRAPSALQEARSQRSSQLREARAYFERAIALDPADAEARLRLGNVAFQLGGDRISQEVLMRLCESPTLHAEDAYLANLFLARVQDRQDQLEAAGASFDGAIALAPGQTALIGRSRNAQRRGNLAEAATFAERAATIKTIEDPWWWYPLGQYWLPAQIFEALRREARQ